VGGWGGGKLETKMGEVKKKAILWGPCFTNLSGQKLATDCKAREKLRTQKGWGAVGMGGIGDPEEILHRGEPEEDASSNRGRRTISTLAVLGEKKKQNPKTLCLAVKKVTGSMADGPPKGAGISRPRRGTKVNLSIGRGLFPH